MCHPERSEAEVLKCVIPSAAKRSRGTPIAGQIRVASSPGAPF